MSSVIRKALCSLPGAASIAASLAIAGLLGLSACSGGTAGDPANRGPFKVLLASTGLGQLYPYRINELDEKGKVTQKVIDIIKAEDLQKNISATNGVLPLAVWPTTATLPGGGAGNQYLLLKFSHELKVTSLLSDLPANQSNSGLTGALQLLEYDPVTEVTSVVRGRAFVGGYTYYDDPTTGAFDLKLVKAVEADDNGNVTILDARANGFPRGFDGDEELVSTHSFVFVPDTDSNLLTFETFPTNKVMRVFATNSIQDYRSKPLVEEICTATTVGTDTTAPQILGFLSGNVQIAPGNGQTGVDPTSAIRVNFSKPVQPREVGQFFSSTDLTPSFRGISINVTIASNTERVLYYADPVSPSDLCNYIVRPAYFLPGNVPVSLTVNRTINSTSGVLLGTAVSTNYTTGKGPGLVNAPVAPEVIYVGRAGANAGVSVIDLNGFGQGTGDLTKAEDPNYKIGFKRNPNIGQPGIFPPLSLGTSNMDAGSLGTFTLAVDTNLSTRLLDSTVLSQVSDIHVGQPLDKVFNNENINPNYTRANQTNPLQGNLQWGNTISAPPVPNPPRLRFPPPNPGKGIFGEDPTASSQVAAPPCIIASARNLLVKGNPFADRVGQIGLLHSSFPGAFYGPQPPPGSPQPPLPSCPYNSRQQIGHFLYVLDREKRQVLVVNSNRMRVLETIKLPDPTSMAVSPNLRRLAVSNFGSGTVSFIDTDPASPSFHQVVEETQVGRGPSQVCWQPEGEDLLVINEIGNSMSIINGADLTLRKTVGGLINSPIDVVATLRQNGIGFATGIYFAYILNSNGTVAIYESGPDGVNGIGFDDVIGIPEQATFKAARRMQRNPTSFVSSVYIAHVDDSNLGQISHLELTASSTGPLPISANSGGFILPPTFRQRQWTVNSRIGGAKPTNPLSDRLSGNAPVDFALEELNNVGAYVDMTSIQVSNLAYADHSGKSQVKVDPLGNLVPAYTPRFMFVALADTGKVDVLEIKTSKVVATIDVPGVRVLSSYWKH